MSKTYIIKSTKKKFMQINMALFSEYRGGVFTRAGAFIGIFMVDVPEKISKDIISMELFL